MAEGQKKGKNETLKLAAQVFLKTVVAAIMSLIVYISLSVVIIGMNTQTIGYRLYELIDGEQVLLEEKYYDDTVTSAPPAKEGQLVEGIMSEPPAAAMILLNVLSEVVMLVMLSIFIVTPMKEKGQRDLTQVKYRNGKEDKLCGLKIGLLASLPAFAAYLLLIVAKLTGLMPWYLLAYRYINICFLPLINTVAGTAIASAEISWLALLVILLFHAFVPLVCHIAYIMGYKQVDVTDKLVYKKPSKKKR